MAYIGNGPGVASQRITTTLTATASQTTFTPTSGYTVGYIDVYLNGVRLVNGTDYTASNGTTVVLASGAAENDVMEIVAYLPRGLSDGYTKAEADSRYMSASATTLPSQTDNSGKFLTTDGTDASWATINVSPTPADVSDQANTSTGYFDLPAGTTAQRPGSPASGMVRFNTTLGEPEWYDPAGSQWLKFSQGSNYTIEYLVVAGGGAGGSSPSTSVTGGGGGAGGVIDSTEIIIPLTAYTITVGAGGSIVNYDRGNNGSNSSAFSQTAIGGGGGGGPSPNAAGLSGGSGGGGAGWNTGTNLGGSGTSGQGNAGGNGGGQDPSAGGGGATAVGGTSVNYVPGVGGAGLNWKSLGTSYGGGGGGGAKRANGDSTYLAGGVGGAGGGGNGGDTSTYNGSPGSANTGGGGGGCGVYYPASPQPDRNGGAGGSGIVIIRYLGSQRGTGGTVTSSGGYTYHTFTTSGTFVA